MILTAPRFSLLWGPSHISVRPTPSFPQVGTPGPIKCKGNLKVPKLINKDPSLLSNSRERGSLPVGPHPRLFFLR